MLPPTALTTNPLELIALPPHPPDEFKEGERGCECPRVLIVDDNEYNLFVLQSYLTSMHEVTDEVLSCGVTNIGAERRGSD